MSIARYLTLPLSREFDMNTKKYKNYALGTLVLVIWGLIIVRIVSHFKTDSYEPVVGSETVISAGFKVSKESFTIDGKYPDPFLKNIKSSEVVKQRSVSNEHFNQTKVSSIAYWPAILYGGVVETSDKKQRLAIISIDQQNFLVNERDSISQIKILKVFRDSVRVRFNNVERTIARTNDE